MVCLRRRTSRKAWAGQCGTLLVSTVFVISQTCFLRSTHSAKAYRQSWMYGCRPSGNRSDARRPSVRILRPVTLHTCIALGRASPPNKPPNRPPGPKRAKSGLRHRTRALPKRGAHLGALNNVRFGHGFSAEGFQGFFTRPKGVESDVSAGSSASRQSGFPPPLFRSTDGAAAPNLSERRGGAQSTFSANLLPLAFLV
jgi:hypothetical protein